MFDLFISYAHSDIDKVRKIAALLINEGWTVWWDKGIKPGMKWEDEIDTALNSCKAILVIWSKASQESSWVYKEVNKGIERNNLIPILIEKDSIPAEFTNIQASDLTNWHNKEKSSEINALFDRIYELIPASRKDTVRGGFSSHFLGPEYNIPLPSVSGTASVLPYNNFSVVFNPTRRLAYYTAYNIDGKSFIKHRRPNNTEWQPDPLLPDSLQINMSVFEKSEFDRGHLMSPLTICWGNTRSADIAQKQAFYWSNMAPQHKLFNRIWWLKLEKFERDIALKLGLMTGFSGIGFQPDDKLFRDSMQFDNGLIASNTFRIPSLFWKVIFIKQNEKLLNAAFLMNQFEMLNKNIGRNINILDYQVSLKTIKEKTGIGFETFLLDSNLIDFNSIK